MADLKFSQSASRNYLVPILLALVVLGAAFAVYMRLTPAVTIDITAPHVGIFATHTVFKRDSGDGQFNVIGGGTSQDDLYVLATVHIDDHLKLPVFLKDFTATLIAQDGQLLTASAVEKNDLPNLYTTYPELKKMASAPLLRETEIQPGQSAEGMVLFHFPAVKDAWDRRKTASISVDFYHQPPQSVSLDTNRQPLIPKS